MSANYRTTVALESKNGRRQAVYHFEMKNWLEFHFVKFVLCERETKRHKWTMANYWTDFGFRPEDRSKDRLKKPHVPHTVFIRLKGQIERDSSFKFPEDDDSGRKFLMDWLG